MLAAVTLVRNPFYPERDREVRPVLSPASVRGWLIQQGIEEFDRPTICLFNGQAVLRADWENTFINDNDVVAFVTLPQGGGGGGGGGKNPLRTVLSIAVMVASFALGGPLGAAMGISANAGAALGIGAGVLQQAIGGAIISLAGMALMNAVVPAPKPSVPSLSFGSLGAPPAPSPTYSLSAQGNEARLGQPIPVLYGRHLIYPDLATQPYQEFVNNEQYLFQLHVIGQGEFDLEQVRIEDTPISSFEEVETEIVGPGGIVTLFETDVVTAPEVAGQELRSTGDGGDWIGPFTANPAETKAGHIGIDVVFARGLYYANDSGGLDTRSAQWEVQARTIDDEGLPIGDWLLLGTESYTASTNSALRISYKYVVSSGRYEVRMIRLDTIDTSSRAGHELRWGAVRSYLEGIPEFGNVTRLAVKMRATDNLSQRSSRMINCVVTRKLSIWTSETGWSSPEPTRSIAWAFADACQGAYGAGLAEARMDLQALTELDQTWSARGDTFDGVFDSTMTVWEALIRIARCGRAVPVLQGGVVRLFRDAQQTLPVAMFSPRNIVKGSFKIQYIMPGDDTADAVTVEFFNSRTWNPDEVTSSLPDSAAQKPAKVMLFGCTNEPQAKREGLYMAADNRYRRKLVSWQTELDGLIPTYGDLVAVTHDMPRWGQGGEVVSWDPETSILEVSEPLDWSEGVDHYIALRRRDGSPAGPFKVQANGDDMRSLRILDALDFVPYTGTAEERSHFAFGPGEAWSAKARVIAVRPRGELVEITAVGEDVRVHEADLAA
ncbi:MAG: host specificity factor TipJ family phage tail protein [Gammaproteobacteria bacterium]|nr:phage tail protein [Magnetovibrio sp.]MDW3206121.1 host specificity factor TipJ family phage tail protein [Alphaproteobacteria bacterium]HCS70032.1 phage tail protein [Rhodospirillaceae bacterium]|tara:strand:+ start:17356 stop:19686 length:2331 start_codon:yes stop_codon:yes gene_type:complete